MKTELYLGDCLNLLKSIPNNSIDLTVTSPPYDALRTYNGKLNQWSFEKFQGIASELFRVTKHGGVVVWIVSDSVINGSESCSSFKQALFFKELGFNLHDTMIWMKDSSAFPEHVRYSQIFEYMFVFSNGKPKTFHPIADRKNKYAGMKVRGTFRNSDGTTKDRSTTWKNTICKEYGNRFNVWQIPSEKSNKSGHPAVFPERLITDHIISWTDAGDTVLDPMMGSGTTGAASVNTDRNFIGMEIDETYFNIAYERIKEVTNMKG